MCDSIGIFYIDHPFSNVKIQYSCSYWKKEIRTKFILYLALNACRLLGIALDYQILKVVDHLGYQE